MKKDKGYKEALKGLALISQLGISMVTPILLGLFIGQFLDKKLGTTGVFAIIFMLLGVGGGFVNLFKITGTKKDKEEDKRK